jgi:hypothetical protein
MNFANLFLRGQRRESPFLYIIQNSSDLLDVLDECPFYVAKNASDMSNTSNGRRPLAIRERRAPAIRGSPAASGPGRTRAGLLKRGENCGGR